MWLVVILKVMLMLNWWGIKPVAPQLNASQWSAYGHYLVKIIFACKNNPVVKYLVFTRELNPEFRDLVLG